jgi:hypothetical protein
MTVPYLAAQGTWTASWFLLEDQAGNEANLTAADLQAAGLPTSFEQTGTGDSTPPQLQSFSFTPDSVNTAASDQTITVTAHITDDLSGVACGGGFSCPQVQFKGPSGQTIAAVFGPGTLVSGNAQDGVYRTTTTVPHLAAQGNWTASWFLLEDQAGNEANLTAADLTAAGLPTTFTNG